MQRTGAGNENIEEKLNLADNLCYTCLDIVFATKPDDCCSGLISRNVVPYFSDRMI